MKKMKPENSSTANSEVLIFIHGAFVSSRMWEKQVEYFKKHYKVVTYDLRGHGMNSGIGDAPLSFDVYTADLKKIIEQLDEREKPIICGLSLGGMIAQHFAVRYPDSYKSLILCDTSATVSLTIWDRLMHFLLPKWLLVSLVNLYSVKTIVKQFFFMAKLTRGVRWLGREQTIAYEKEEMLKMTKPDMKKVFNVIYSFKKQKLSNIRVPVLILLGQYEPRSTYKHAEILNREISKSELQIIMDAGHMPNIDQANAFNEALHSFIARVTASQNGEN